MGASLPMEVDVSLGMRKYYVLITVDRDLFSIFRRDQGWYVFSEEKSEGVNGRREELLFMREVSKEKKRKSKM